MRAILGIVAILALTGCVPQPPTTATPSTPAPLPTEDGFFVRKYPDGSASVSRSADVLADRWSIDCGIDQMSDKRDCSITTENGGPFVYFGSSSSPQSICILGHDFPGRTGQIRIDKNSPIATDAEGCVSAARVLTQMKSGNEFLSRWTKWPYDYHRDSRYSLDGFNKALSVVAEIQQGNLQ